MIYQKDIEHFLDEDLRYEDVSGTLVPCVDVEAVIFTKEPCTVSGTEVAAAVFDYMKIDAVPLVRDGDRLNAGDPVFRIKGRSVSVLRAERLVLNFLSHLSGIATETAACVSLAAEACLAVGTRPPRIACTRKTMPGLRKYEKEAVRHGGGDAHRHDAAGCVMIKDNHIAVMGLENALKSAREKASFTQKIDVEVEAANDAVTVAAMGADIVMLDNMTPDRIEETVRALEAAGLRSRVILEASGGIAKKELPDYAVSGVDVISLSAVITRAPWIDMSLDIVPE